MNDFILVSLRLGSNYLYDLPTRAFNRVASVTSKKKKFTTTTTIENSAFICKRTWHAEDVIYIIILSEQENQGTLRVGIELRLLARISTHKAESTRALKRSNDSVPTNSLFPRPYRGRLCFIVLCVFVKVPGVCTDPRIEVRTCFSDTVRRLQWTAC